MFNAFTGTIYGRVQGVGFRYFAKGTADNLGLRGWVQNLPNESVAVFATGPKKALEQFMHSLKVGPIGSQVADTKFQWLETSEKFKGFEIRG
jgi:acylphosphatase